MWYDSPRTYGALLSSGQPSLSSFSPWLFYPSINSQCNAAQIVRLVLTGMILNEPGCLGCGVWRGIANRLEPAPKKLPGAGTNTLVAGVTYK